MAESLELAQRSAGVLDENKAEDVIILEVGDHLWITDYFVIATGQSDPHIKFLQEEVAKIIAEEMGREPSISEGTADEGWLLTDFGDVIVHIFTGEQRDYYNLEGLWSDADQIPTKVNQPD